MSLTKVTYSMIQGASANVLDFGAVGDGVTDDTTAVQNALDYCQTNSVALFFPSGTYVINDTITKPESFFGVNMFGEGAKNSILDFSSISTFGKPGLLIIGGSGQLANSSIQSIGFKGNQNVRAIEIQGQCGQKFQNCSFDDFLVGGYFHNKATGSFSEFDVFENCFFKDCFLAIEYARDLGDDSFHGSGLLNCVVDNFNNAVARIRVNANCKPYSAPMTAQFFVNSNCAIIENIGAQSCTFYGVISVETFSDLATLASNAEVGLVGGVSYLGTPPVWGTLTVARDTTIDSSGVLQSLDSMWVSQPTAINTSAFSTIYAPRGMTKGARLIVVYFEGTFVEATYVLLSLASPYGFYPTPTIVAKNIADNGGFSGADPIFALETVTSGLQIKQGLGPATDATAKAVFYQLGVGAASTPWL